MDEMEYRFDNDDPYDAEFSAWLEERRSVLDRRIKTLKVASALLWGVGGLTTIVSLVH